MDSFDGSAAARVTLAPPPPPLLLQGRRLIWAWLQEQPNPGGAHDYAGCISTPRLLELQGGRLVQAPLPELERLRSGRGLRLKGLPLPHGRTWSLPGHVCACHLDLTLHLASRGAQRVQLVLAPLQAHRHHHADPPAAASGDPRQQRETRADGAAVPSSDAHGGSSGGGGPPGAAPVQAAGITYEFSTCQLQVLVGEPGAVEHALQQQNRPFAAPEAARGRLCDEDGAVPVGAAPLRVPATPPPSGGRPAAAPALRALRCQLRGAAGADVALRLLLDYSTLELFTGTGEVLTSRVYRGRPASAAAAAAAAARGAAAEGGGLPQGHLGAVGDDPGVALAQRLARHQPGWIGPADAAAAAAGPGATGGGPAAREPGPATAAAPAAAAPAPAAAGSGASQQQAVADGASRGALVARAEVSLMSVGGDAMVTRLEAHEMGSMWGEPQG